MQVLLTAASFEASPCDQASAEASSLLARSPTGRARPDASIGLSGIPPDSRESASVADGGLSEASPCDQVPAGASRFQLDRLLGTPSEVKAIMQLPGSVVRSLGLAGAAGELRAVMLRRPRPPRTRAIEEGAPMLEETARTPKTGNQL